MKNTKWIKNGGVQLSKKTVGIIGFGNVGQEFASLLQPFDCKILVNDILPIPKKWNNLVTTKTLNDLLKSSDIVSIHVPLNNETFNLINEEQLQLLKDNSLIINTSRGGILNENALIKQISKKNIFAALDVFENEPNIKKDLLKSNNIYCTPHIGGNADEAVLAMGSSSILHLNNFFYGK